VVIAIVGTVVARHPQPPAAGTVTATIKVGSGPVGVATDTHAVSVANKDSGTVSRIDR